MKKTIAAVAALCAVAGSVAAADVEIYGTVSTGLVFTHTKGAKTVSTFDKSTGTYTLRNHEKSNNLKMGSAWAGDTIFGLRGQEQIGTWHVGFVLESDFDSDTGSLFDPEALFDSKTYLWAGNGLVKFSAGNLGGLLSSGLGDFDMVSRFSPLEDDYGNGGMGLFTSKDLGVSNAVAIEVTPAEGLTMTFMSSIEDGANTNTGWNTQSHYYGLGGTYENGPFAISAVAERIKWPKRYDLPSTGLYTLGISWDFGGFKPSFMYQRSKDYVMASFSGGLFEDFLTAANGDLFINPSYVSDSFLLGATAPLGQGTLGVSAQYLEVRIKGIKQADTGDRTKGTAYVFGAAYNYKISKRTALYIGGAYSKGRDFLKDIGTLNNYEVGAGLNHRF